MCDSETSIGNKWLFNSIKLKLKGNNLGLFVLINVYISKFSLCLLQPRRFRTAGYLLQTSTAVFWHVNPGGWSRSLNKQSQKWTCINEVESIYLVSHEEKQINTPLIQINHLPLWPPHFLSIFKCQVGSCSVKNRILNWFLERKQHSTETTTEMEPPKQQRKTNLAPLITHSFLVSINRCENMDCSPAALYESLSVVLHYMSTYWSCKFNEIMG